MKTYETIRYASVCSGVEAATLAWGPLGWRPVFFSEVEPFPCAVLATRFPKVPNLGDMTKIEGEKYYETVDLLVGGTPCQDVSVAGKRKGFAGERSGLAFSYIRLLETMRPRWFVWENVPGVLSTSGGEDFKAFIRSIDEIGYSCAWRVLDAQFTRVDGFPRAVPQRRRRVFVIGHLGADWRHPASVLFEPDCLPRATPPRRKAGTGVARSVTASTGGASGKEQQLDFVGGNGKPLNAIESGHGLYSESDAAQTIKAQEDQHRRNMLCMATQQGGAEITENYCPTITEAAGTSGNNQPIVCMATGQGGAETGEDCAVNLTCNHEAPLICAGFCQGASPTAGSIGYHEQVSPTIKAGESGTAQVPAVICVHGGQDRSGVLCYENHMQDSRVKECGQCSPQINAKAGTGGGNLPIVQTIGYYPSQHQSPRECETPTLTAGNCGSIRGDTPLVQSIAIAENIIGRQVENGGNGVGAQEEVAYTQNCTGVMGVSQNETVRRLTPVECERLMGFPEVNVLEIGRMTKDEFIAWEIAVGNITVDTENGLVYSTRTSGGRKSESPILLEGTETPTGYLVVSLREKEDKRQCRVHRIIWIAEHGVPPEGMTIDHINNDKKDNRLVNLQLMTSIENSSKAHADGLVKHKTKISDEQKNEIITLYQEHEIPIRKLATMFGISKSRVHQLIHSTGWTRIPWRGKPEEDCPDSPRYKACGNSMCVNVMRWIGMRIELVERRTKP